jgi:hypothetical protein
MVDLGGAHMLMAERCARSISTDVPGEKMSRRTVLVLGALLSLLILMSAPVAAVAAERAEVNRNPTDWTIVTTFVGALGDDIPLRVGKADFRGVPGLIFPGFGERHILEAHGAVPPDEVIDDVLQNGTCVSEVFERFRCRTDEAEVAFVREVNPDSGDDLPVGIVSAFFRAPTADE